MKRLSPWILQKLSRVTSSGSLVPEIDALRFIAILGVVLFHSHGRFLVPDGQGPQPWGYQSLSWLMLKGWFGVQLFFIISGFILSMPFAQHRLSGGREVSLGKYYLRRVTRLEPPYIINLLLAMLAAVLVSGQSLQWCLPHFATGVAYSHNITYIGLSLFGPAGAADGWNMNPLNFVIWTLEIEVQFYMLAPLLAAVFAVRSTIWRRTIIAGGILLSCLQPIFLYNDFLNMTILGQVRYFLLGFLLADIYLVNWQSRPAKSRWWDVIGVAAWVSVPFVLSPGEVLQSWPAWGQAVNALDAALRSALWPRLPSVLAMGNIVLPAILVIAYMAAFRGRVINRFFTNPWIVVIGGMCYTIYLYHITLIHWGCVLVESLSWCLYRVWPGISPNIVPGNLPQSLVQMIAVLAVVLVGCSVLFVLFEKPFMRKDWPAKAAAAFGRLMTRLRARLRRESAPVVDRLPAKLEIKVLASEKLEEEREPKPR